MRKITKQITAAFLAGKSLTIANTETDGQSIWLYNNKIAEKTVEGIKITNAGWSSNTTKERLNAIPGVNIYQKNFTWFLNGVEWDGSWRLV